MLSLEPQSSLKAIELYQTNGRSCVPRKDGGALAGAIKQLSLVLLISTASIATLPANQARAGRGTETGMAVVPARVVPAVVVARDRAIPPKRSEIFGTWSVDGDCTVMTVQLLPNGKATYLSSRLGTWQLDGQHIELQLYRDEDERHSGTVDSYRFRVVFLKQGQMRIILRGSSAERTLRRCPPGNGANRLLSNK
ncbi:MAG: hypothetical protein P8Z76_17050 [Alphaproteobacteria bacterium]